MRTEFLARVGARMAASMDLETTLQEIATAAVPVVADWCSIVLVEADGHLRTHAVAHVDPARTAMAWELAERYPPRRDADAGAGRVIRTGEAEHLAEITPEMIDRGAVDDAHREALHELGLRSALSVPLRRPGRVLGALTLVYAESGRTFGSEDLALARALAGRASLHIHNSRLYTELSHIATTLQRSLLPRRLPDVPGMEVGTRYLPVGEYNEVGGDFYDLFPSDPGVWTALIGDVSGKGADAAAITALARHTLRAAALRSSDPAENLMLLNDTMLADATTSRFCTVSYARLRPDPDGIGVTFANGGHMPPLILRADGRLDQVEMPGSLVGALQEPVFTTREERLAPGDLLLLYTDGVTDLRTRMPRSGERQLAETLERMTGRSVEDVLAAVTDMAVRAQDGRPRDDIALLAIRAV
jgi:serine phosphatase RsbU (regulator of sigma subunit)